MYMTTGKTSLDYMDLGQQKVLSLLNMLLIWTIHCWTVYGPYSVGQNTEGSEMGAGLVKGRKNLCRGVLNVMPIIISPTGDAN